ncbi:Hypp1830 [Branchiostoma lanceolatum]|uniref:Hypp1830 protein n=1 Tax=Branchiostoma lanceolatum TaxID=7740 RepID=A0A8J9ZND4_BRALA|nr:Hypp1830 [Branchiostoma lanceolatum]
MLKPKEAVEIDVGMELREMLGVDSSWRNCDVSMSPDPSGVSVASMEENTDTVSGVRGSTLLAASSVKLVMTDVSFGAEILAVGWIVVPSAVDGVKKSKLIEGVWLDVDRLGEELKNKSVAGPSPDPSKPGDDSRTVWVNIGIVCERKGRSDPDPSKSSLLMRMKLELLDWRVGDSRTDVSADPLGPRVTDGEPMSWDVGVMDKDGRRSSRDKLKEDDTSRSRDGPVGKGAVVSAEGGATDNTGCGAELADSFTDKDASGEDGTWTNMNRSWDEDRWTGNADIEDGIC